MPRMQSLESPGAMVHIMARGLDGMCIFRQEEDKEVFLRRFTSHIADVGYHCYAWCLMDNHYHFFLRTNELPMSRLMRPLNGGYARWFNRKYRRRGYVFQDRFKSVVCQDSAYARELIRYIHLNPLRAGYFGTVKALGRFRWSGHNYLTKGTCKWSSRFVSRNTAHARELIPISKIADFLGITCSPAARLFRRGKGMFGKVTKRTCCATQLRS
ncbi:MAG: transposase [Chitinivibrionales bacterium]|nr:transposase [Chitinivibrionales bacterium]